MADAGPPGASGNGFNENLSLFQQGKCGMWIDATVAASFVTNPAESTVYDQVGFALAPDTGLGKRGNWLWAWALAIPAGTQKEAAARQFIEWATSKQYIELVASKEGWANVPPGARTSLYENPNYKDIPFARLTLESILSADPNNPTVDPVPYIGIQFAAIPEFAGIATEVGQEFSAALARPANCSRGPRQGAGDHHRCHGSCRLLGADPPHRENDGLLTIPIPRAARTSILRATGVAAADECTAVRGPRADHLPSVRNRPPTTMPVEPESPEPHVLP